MDATPEMTKRKLLLADDSVTIRKVVELTFAEEGIEVISAANGDEAMQRFVERTPDIVLVDVEMPGMNGYKICEMIKGDESTRDIPVLLLVGSFEPFDQDEAERVLADGFLTKPFHSIRELVGRVNELLDEVSPRPTPETADIEDLYNSSFAETMPLHEEVTEEDLHEASYRDADDELALAESDPASGAPASFEPDLGEPALDDEMIETLPVAGEPVEEEFLEEPSIDDEMIETHSVAGESVDMEDFREPSFDNETIETSPVIAESVEKDYRDEQPSVDDEMIETSPAADAPLEEEYFQEPSVGSEMETFHAETGSANGYADATSTADTTKVGDLAWESPIDEAADDDTGVAVAAAGEGRHLSLGEDVAVDPAIHDSHADTEEIASPYASVEPFPQPAPPVEEPAERTVTVDLTEETINLIARRVVEKLSDRVVRDIAQEAVPRITEKLIREALEEEGKS